MPHDRAFSADEAAAYLAAMIDGEGWIGEPRTVFNRAVRISNTDPDIIDAIRECCAVLGITYTVYAVDARKPSWSDQQMVVIAGRDNMRRIHAVVPIRAARKRARLERTLASYRRPEPLQPERLQALYDEGLTQQQIADHLGVGIKRVRLAFRRHGIRSRHGQSNPAIWRTRRARYGAAGRR